MFYSGAWPYLELIASANAIADPLDARVVEAYWVGSELLEGIPATSLLEAIGRHPESGPDGGAKLREAVTAGGVAHHSFHVFAVYPWLALLRSGKREPALTVLERCRIRWGRIEAVEGETSSSVADHSAWMVATSSCSTSVQSRLTQGVGGLGFVENLVPGDLVSLHWDWVCDRLQPGAVAHLEHFTLRSLLAVNAIEIRP